MSTDTAPQVSPLLKQGKGAQSPPLPLHPIPWLTYFHTRRINRKLPLLQPRSQAHSALESNPGFRLISHWNQMLISGSFVDWNMLLSDSLQPYSTFANGSTSNTDAGRT